MIETPATIAPPKIGRARKALFRRLIDVAALPSSQISVPDRSMVGDVLLEMLFEASDADRKLCARRLSASADAPRRLLRYLAQCNYEVAEPLLLHSDAFDATDLAEIVQLGGPEHRLAIAERRSLPIGATDALASVGEPHVLRLALRNATAKFSEQAMDILVERSREFEELTTLLARRPEIRPAQAMAMFWWSDGNTRREILLRQASERTQMIAQCSDVFPIAAEEKWADPLTRKTLQLVERRQRNRAATQRSPFDSLEQAISVAALEGMTPIIAQEIGYLAGIKPVTVAKILSDAGGEGLAVLCKATGMRIDMLETLWTALRRPLTDDSGSPSVGWTRVSALYGLLSLARAQTTLRYWNWSMSTSFSPQGGLLKAPGDDDDKGSFSTSQRTARLVFR